jgi:hypothetical protein
LDRRSGVLHIGRWSGRAAQRSRWVEDTQVVVHLAARLRARGLEAVLASPHHLRWVDGRARIDSDFRSAAVDAVIRFYQVEWIVDLPCTRSWMPLFRGGRTPVTNPGCVALTETKRLPLVWSELDASTATWRGMLPEARDPRDTWGLLAGGWVLKPAFGNTRDDVAIRDCMLRSRRSSRSRSRFEPRASSPGSTREACAADSVGIRSEASGASFPKGDELRPGELPMKREGDHGRVIPMTEALAGALASLVAPPFYGDDGTEKLVALRNDVRAWGCMHPAGRSSRKGVGTKPSGGSVSDRRQHEAVRSGP